MSVLNKEVIDGMAVDTNENALRLLISDELDWNDEYNHLINLQEKINNYVAFWETKQYKQTYDVELTHAIIEIHFMFDITENAEAFLNQVQNLLSDIRMVIECYIDGE